MSMGYETFQDESLEELCRKAQRMADPHYLSTMSMTELFQTSFQDRPPLIRGLLHTGVYILAGAPKIGKSFLVAQIAYHVSRGEQLWGYEVSQGTVLYLALEDDFRRIQRRMFMLYGVEDTPELYFATSAGKLGQELDMQLENFVMEHRDTRLVIIDTLQKVRESGGEAYSYAGDYEIIARLKGFADAHGLCVLLVHHTRKQQAGDSFEMISGTTGLMGCADGALLMKKEQRTSLQANIEIVGRDQEEQILYLKRSPETQVLELERREKELYREPPDRVLEAVAGLVNDESREWTGSPTELAEAAGLDMAANALSKYLNVKAGSLLEKHRVAYENRATHGGRRVKLSFRTAQ